MFCLNCGSNITGGAKFCPVCGTKYINTNVNGTIQNINTILLKCKNCNGELSINEDRQIMLCPYCGGKELIVESDVIKVAKITSNAYRDVELRKQQVAMEMKRMDIHEKNKEQTRSIYSKIIGLLMLLAGIGIFIFCVEYQELFDGGARLFITVLCLVLFIVGICLLCRKKHTKD